MMRTMVARLLLLPLLVAPLLATAPGAAPAQPAPAAISPDQRAFWSNSAAQLRTRVAAAALREEAATAAYSRMLTRRYPAGDAKLAIIEDRDAAQKEYADAVAEVREFKELARRAGVPDSWIDPDGDAPPWWVDPQ